MWTEPETLLLLEAVLKHGDDWDLIAQHVRTKNKLDCIARLVHLPFGEHMLGPIRNKLESSRNSSNEVAKATQSVVKEQSGEPIASANEPYTDTNENNKIAEESSPSRPTKRRCLPSLTGVTESLMKQVDIYFCRFAPNNFIVELIYSSWGSLILSLLGSSVVYCSWTRHCSSCS